MKIRSVRTHLVDGSYDGKIGRNYIFVVMETDEGITGFGEATTWPAGTIVKSTIDEVAGSVIGRNPFNIEATYMDLFRSLTRGGTSAHAMAALSGIEMAMWDIVGKGLNVPVCNLFGGPVRNSVQVYANYWYKSLPYDRSAYVDKAEQVVADGYRALKFDPFAPHVNSNTLFRSCEMRYALDLVAAVVEAVGPGVGVAVEAAGRFNHWVAFEVSKALEEMNIMWLEEPIRHENTEAMATLRQRVRIPIAGGESLYTRHEFRRLFEKQAVDVVQPDIARTGGILESRKIAAMAECYCLPLSPHNPNGPVCTAAALHVCCSSPNATILEFLYEDQPWTESLTDVGLKVQDGALHVPERPGLGVCLDLAAVERHPARKSIPLRA